MDEEAIRNMMADQMAASFLVEIMLVDYLKKFPASDRAGLLQAMQRASRKTEHFAGLAPNEKVAELLADVTVRMHSALDGYLERAVARLGAV